MQQSEKRKGKMQQSFASAFPLVPLKCSPPYAKTVKGKAWGSGMIKNLSMDYVTILLSSRNYLLPKRAKKQREEWKVISFWPNQGNCNFWASRSVLFYIFNRMQPTKREKCSENTLPSWLNIYLHKYLLHRTVMNSEWDIAFSNSSRAKYVADC